MKAPEKIYIAVYQNDDGLDTHLGDWYSEPEYHAEDNLEYIRKDALMEWAKEHKCVIETHGDERDAYLRGEYSILNSLIDKLNSI